MKAARALRWARRRAGLSQRALAEKTGVPQSTIGRIEAGTVDPRVGTLSRLLRACEFDLEVEPLLGKGVDRTLIREMLALSPEQRLARLVQQANEFIESESWLFGATKRTGMRVDDGPSSGK